MPKKTKIDGDFIVTIERFQKSFKYFRIMSGFTQNDVARVLNFTRNTVWRLEDGLAQLNVGLYFAMRYLVDYWAYSAKDLDLIKGLKFLVDDTDVDEDVFDEAIGILAGAGIESKDSMYAKDAIRNAMKSIVENLYEDITVESYIFSQVKDRFNCKKAKINTDLTNEDKKVRLQFCLVYIRRISMLSEEEFADIIGITVDELSDLETLRTSFTQMQYMAVMYFVEKSGDKDIKAMVSKWIENKSMSAKDLDTILESIDVAVNSIESAKYDVATVRETIVEKMHAIFDNGNKVIEENGEDEEDDLSEITGLYGPSGKEKIELAIGSTNQEYQLAMSQEKPKYNYDKIIRGQTLIKYIRLMMFENQRQFAPRIGFSSDKTLSAIEKNYYRLSNRCFEMLSKYINTIGGCPAALLFDLLVKSGNVSDDNFNKYIDRMENAIGSSKSNRYNIESAQKLTDEVRAILNENMYNAA